MGVEPWLFERPAH